MDDKRESEKSVLASRHDDDDNDLCKLNTIEKCTKGYILTFPKNCDLKITKNYKGIILSIIADKIYNVLLINCIRSLEKSKWFREKSIDNFSDSHDSLNHREYT